MECLRARIDLRLLEAATGDAAVALAEHECPDLLIVDEPERNVLGRLSQMSAIVMVDDVPYCAPALGERIHLLARPFSTELLMAVVDRVT